MTDITEVLLLDREKNQESSFLYFGYMERQRDDAVMQRTEKKKGVTAVSREREIGHNHCNQLNKAFLCLGPNKCTWKHLLISQESKCQSVLGGFRISSPSGVCYDFIQHLTNTSHQLYNCKTCIHTHTES